MQYDFTKNSSVSVTLDFPKKLDAFGCYEGRIAKPIITELSSQKYAGNCNQNETAVQVKSTKTKS